MTTTSQDRLRFMLEQLIEYHGIDRTLQELSKICGERMHASAGHDIGDAMRWYELEAALLAIVESSANPAAAARR